MYIFIYIYIYIYIISYGCYKFRQCKIVMNPKTNCLTLSTSGNNPLKYFFVRIVPKFPKLFFFNST